MLVLPGEPRNTKIFLLTLATVSPSHGMSSNASGSDSANAFNVSYRDATPADDTPSRHRGRPRSVRHGGTGFDDLTPAPSRRSPPWISPARPCSVRRSEVPAVSALHAHSRDVPVLPLRRG